LSSIAVYIEFDKNKSTLQEDLPAFLCSTRA